MADDGSGSDVTIPSMLLYKQDSDLFKQTIIEQNQTMRIELIFPSPTSSSLFTVNPISTTSTTTSNNNNNVPNKKDKSTLLSSSLQHQTTFTDHDYSPKVKAAASVAMDYWMTPTDRISMEFLARFQPIALALGSRLEFTPHLYIIDGTKSGCLGQPDMTFNEEKKGPVQQPQHQHHYHHHADKTFQNHMPCFNLCTNRGLYCAPDPNGNLHTGSSGADVVVESLRQLCIWSLSWSQDAKHANNNKKGGNSGDPPRTLWWKYIAEYYHSCFAQVTTTPWNNNNKGGSSGYPNDCIEQVYKKLGISKMKIDQCMADSGGLSGIIKNNKLQHEIEIIDRKNIFVVPTLQLDHAGQRFEGSVQDVIGTICEMLLATTKTTTTRDITTQEEFPMICHAECVACSDPVACATKGGKCPAKSSLSSSSSSAVYTQAAYSRAHATLTTVHDTTRLSHQSRRSKSRREQQQQRGSGNSSGNYDFDDNGVTPFTFFVSVVIVASLGLLVGSWNRKRTKYAARNHVRAIMSDYYIPLRDQEMRDSNRNNNNNNNNNNNTPGSILSTMAFDPSKLMQLSNDM